MTAPNADGHASIGSVHTAPNFGYCVICGKHVANVFTTCDTPECRDALRASLIATRPVIHRDGDNRPWQQAALSLGKILGSSGPPHYYELTPDQWLEWAVAEVGARYREKADIKAELHEALRCNGEIALSWAADLELLAALEERYDALQALYDAIDGQDTKRLDFILSIHPAPTNALWSRADIDAAMNPTPAAHEREEKGT